MERLDADAGALDVHVIDGHGDPISGANVVARGLLEAVRATSDAAGVARLRGLPVGRVDVVASAPGRAESPKFRVTLPPGRRVAETVLLVRMHRLRVRVIDRTGAPLEGVQVYVTPDDDSAFRSGVTDAEGRCSIDGLSVGGAEITTQPFSGDTHSGVEIPLDGEQIVVLPVSGAIEGRVIERDSGLPVADVEVGWTPDNEFEAHAVSGVDGRFRIQFVTRPSPDEPLEIAAPGFRAISAVPLRPPLSPGSPWRADIVVERTGTVELVVRSDAGPVAGLRVDVEGASRWDSVETDSTGRALISGFAPGVIRLSPRGVSVDGLEPATIVVPETGHTVVPVRVLMARPLTVRGLVIDEDGAAVSGAIVSTGSAVPAVTDPLGRFELVSPIYYSGMSAVSVMVRAGDEPPTRNHFARELIDDKRVLDDVRVVLLRPAEIRGRIVDEDGRPVPGARLSGWRGRYAVAMDGTFHVRVGCALSSVAPNSSWLFATAPGRERVSIEVARVPGSAQDVGDVVIPRTAVVAGRVVNDVGAPVPGAVVYGGTASTVTDATGSFRVIGDGSVSVVAQGLVGVANVHVGDDSTVVLQRKSPVSGTVVFEDGSPVRGALVTAGDWEMGAKVITDDAGRFAFEHLAQSATDLFVSPLSETHSQGVETYVADVDVTVGSVSLTVRRGGTLRARLLEFDGRPAASIGVVISADELDYVARAATNAAGDVVFQGVPTGTDVSVEVWDERNVVLQQTVRATPDVDLELRLSRAATISGVVRLPDGEIVGDLEVIARPLDTRSFDPGERERERRALIGPDGGFTLRWEYGRRYLLLLKRNKRFMRRLGGGADVAPGASGVELIASRGVTYAGTFVRNDGAPPQTYVSLRPRDPAPGWQSIRTSVKTADDGTFEVPGLEPGTLYAVSARDYPYGGWIHFADIRLGDRGLRGVTLELK